MNAKNANYRKKNDRSMNSSTYHKKDGTNIRAKIKDDDRKMIEEVVNQQTGQTSSNS